MITIEQFLFSSVGTLSLMNSDERQEMDRLCKHFLTEKHQHIFTHLVAKLKELMGRKGKRLDFRLLNFIATSTHLRHDIEQIALEQSEIVLHPYSP